MRGNWLATMVAAGLTVIPVLAEAHEAASKGITVLHPWVRATPGGAKLTAGFLEIKAGQGVRDRLVGVSTPAAGRGELHTHLKEGEIIKMRQIEAIEIPAGGSHILKPSGDHLMLIDLKQPLQEGDIVKLTLTFEKAGEISIDATVEPIGALGPHGFDHQPQDSDSSSTDHGGGHQHH